MLYWETLTLSGGEEDGPMRKWMEREGLLGGSGIRLGEGREAGQGKEGDELSKVPRSLPSPPPATTPSLI